MCKHRPRYWFLATGKNHGRMTHIISAHSIQAARVSMGSRSESYEFSQMMWDDIIRVIGAASPTVKPHTTWAEGPLLFEYNGRIVSVECAG